MKKGSGFHNIGQNNTYSFHGQCLISLAFSYLHLKTLLLKRSFCQNPVLLFCYVWSLLTYLWCTLTMLISDRHTHCSTIYESQLDSLVWHQSDVIIGWTSFRDSTQKFCDTCVQIDMTFSLVHLIKTRPTGLTVNPASRGLEFNN